MKITNVLNDEATLEEIARRAQLSRLDRQMSQADLASAAGVSLPTIERFEASGAAHLATWVRILRALNLLDRLDVVMPEAIVRPIEALKTHGRSRKRASRLRKIATPPKTWTWGDER
jgi:transcriptional regulator with XRE-family HTH domain